MGTRVFHMDTNPTPRAVARAVSEALTRAGVSQREASTRSGIPLTTLSRRLTGNSPLNVCELDALAGIAGVTVVDIVISATGSNDPETAA